MPGCPNADFCGGCALWHIESTQQLNDKQQQVSELLDFANMLPAVTGPTTNYRYKARLSVKYVIKKDKVLVGFREKNGRYLADISECYVLHKKVSGLLSLLQTLIYDLDARMTIPQIEVAINKDDSVALIFRHLKLLSINDQRKILAFAKKNNVIVYLQPGKYTSVHKIWPKDNVELLSYLLPEFNLELFFHPIDFVQINPAINNKMIAKAIQWLELNNKDKVLDLFCGLGNFSLPMATIVHTVVGIEGDKTLTQRASYNTTQNKITNARFYASNLMADCSGTEWLGDNVVYNKVLIDPPRSGAADILPVVIALKPSKILYVSCNPESLAKDAEFLRENGYILEKLCVLDMFPHTKHVESMALFNPLPIAGEGESTIGVAG